MPTRDKASNARKVTPTSLALAAQLKAERAAAGLTINELARRSGVNKTTLSEILNGHKPADISQLDDICKALGVTLLEVFTRTEERRRAGEQRDRRQASSE